MRQTFRKDERLCKKILISDLFSQGTSFTIFPFRVTWRDVLLPGDYPVQLLISVPKSYIRKAHDRNLIKRRVREAYRKNKQEIYGPFSENSTQIALALIYLSKDLLSYSQLQEKIIVILQRLLKDHAQDRG